MHNELGNERPIAARLPSAGLDDLIIVPLVLVAVAISKLLKGVFSILIYVLDYAFPILLQLMRIPLLTARLVGDGMEFFLEGVLQCLPVSRAKRHALRARVRQRWIWFRRNISDAPQVRGLARKTKDGPQARRLLALAAIYDGATRTEAAKIGGVGLQIIRDWVQRPRS